MSVLKGMGFQRNPYEMCVSTEYINRKQCTIAWYVDNNKVSQMEQEIIDDIINKVEETFPGLTVTEVNVHTF